MSAELKGQVNSFLKRAFKCGFCSKLYTIEAIANDAGMDLFCKIAKPRHCVGYGGKNLQKRKVLSLE